MTFYDTKYLFKTLTKRALRIPLGLVPEGQFKFSIRAAMVKTFNSIPPEFLVNPGDTVLLVGFHRIDSVMMWSYLVGDDGHVAVIEAVPEYIDNIRYNLERHLNWPLTNITYISKGVDSTRGRKRIQIGQRADYNKFADQSIVDGISDSEYTDELEIETDTIDQILKDFNINKVNHIHMTISGMEVEALKGMTNTLQTQKLRIHIRSLHTKNDELLYLQARNILENCGMKTVTSKNIEAFRGRDIYASRV